LTFIFALFFLKIYLLSSGKPNYFKIKLDKSKYFAMIVLKEEGKMNRVKKNREVKRNNFIGSQVVSYFNFKTLGGCVGLGLPDSSCAAAFFYSVPDTGHRK